MSGALQIRANEECANENCTSSGIPYQMAAGSSQIVVCFVLQSSLKHASWLFLWYRFCEQKNIIL